MHKHTRFALANRIRDFLRSQGCRQGHITACQSFTNTHNIWLNCGPFPSKEFSCTPETCRDLIEDQQDIVFFAE